MATLAVEAPLRAHGAVGGQRRWPMLRRLVRHRMSMAGALIVLAFLGGALGADILSPYDPVGMSLRDVVQGPSWLHLFGTDEIGRDVLSRMLHGARVSFLIGGLSVAMAGLGGTLLGLISGYYGGWIDSLLMRLLDVALAFPSMLFALLLVAIMGAGIPNMVVSIGVLSIPAFARLVRSVVLSARTQEYVTAARVVGCRDGRVVFRHVLPNCLGPIIVHATFLMGSAILLAGSLSFLGLGVPSPTPEWGAMLGTGRKYLAVAPHLTIAPGLSLLLVILGFNMLGDGLRDALDPRTHP